MEEVSPAITCRSSVFAVLCEVCCIKFTPWSVIGTITWERLPQLNLVTLSVWLRAQSAQSPCSPREVCGPSHLCLGSVGAHCPCADLMCSFQFLGLAEHFELHHLFHAELPGTILSETIWAYLFQSTIWPPWPVSLRRWTRMGSRVSRQEMPGGRFSSSVWLLAGWCTTSSRCLSNWFSRVFKVHQMKSCGRSLSLQPLPGDWPQSPHLQVCARAAAGAGKELSASALVGCTYACGSGTVCLGIPSLERVLRDYSRMSLCLN